MSRPEVRCVVFDIDDTLYLERDYVRSGFRSADAWVERCLGIEGLFRQAWGLFEAGRRGTIFDESLRSLGVDPQPSLVAKLVSLYRGHEPEIALLPDAASCLDAMAPRWRLAAVTDGPLESQQQKARALRLARRLDPIVFTASLGRAFGKPSPEPFRLVQDGAAVPAERCAYVADNPRKDFGGPAALGWRTVRVRRPGGLHVEAPSGDDVDVEIEDLGGLEDALGTVE